MRQKIGAQFLLVGIPSMECDRATATEPFLRQSYTGVKELIWIDTFPTIEQHCKESPDIPLTLPEDSHPNAHANQLIAGHILSKFKKFSRITIF